MCSADLISEIHDWRVSDEESLSDHRHIVFNIRTDVRAATPGRNKKATDWVAYREHLMKVIAAVENLPVGSKEQLNTKASELERVIIEAFQAACPVKRYDNKRKQVPWWNRELSDLRKESREALKRVRVTSLAEDWSRYKSVRNQYGRLIKSSKRESWRRFCTEVQDMSSVARTHRSLHQGQGSKSQLGMLQTAPGVFTVSNEQALTHMLGTHFPGCIVNAGRFSEPDEYLPDLHDWATAARVITRDRVKWSIRSFQPFKAAGVDSIFPKLLQEGCDILAVTLVSIYRACLVYAHIPKNWREVKVVFLPKPGKATYKEAKSFRCISLLSFVQKGLERLVERFVRDTALVRRPLHANQHAYRTGRSTETALHGLVSEIQKALDWKEYALGVFFDIQGAFDNTEFDIVSAALQDREVDPLAERWISAMLKNRQVVAQLGDTRATAQVRRGCPQGGVLSPLLWSLVVDSLIAKLNGLGFYAIGYSDDGAIIVRGRFLDTVCSRMQVALSEVQRWCDEHGLCVNPAKTVMVLFTQNRRMAGLTTPSFYGNRLKFSDSVKVLGVILDSKLKWQRHITDKVNRCTKAMWSCKRMLSSKWGLSPKLTHWLYVGIVRPILMYGALIWWRGAKVVQNQRILERVQRVAMLCISGAMSTTPTAALELLLDLPPLQVLAEQLAMKAAWRISQAGLWGSLQQTAGHRQALPLFMDRIKDAAWGSGDQIAEKFVFDRRYEVSFPSREDWLNRRQELLGDPDITGYTDGSKVNGYSGVGVYLEKVGRSISAPLGKVPSVFQTEVQAIEVCAAALLEEGITSKNICICSDSKAAIQALGAVRVKSAVVWSCVQKLEAVSEQNYVNIKWMPGHRGFQGNVQADHLARTAARALTSQDPVPSVGVPRGSIRQRLMAWSKEEQQRLWQVRSDCRQAKALITKSIIGKPKMLLSLQRSVLKRLVEVLTGHCCLNRHLFIRKLVGDPICPMCGEEEEDAWHFLTECDAYAQIRIRLWGHPWMDPEQFSQLKLEDLLRFIHTSGRFSVGA
ncbi:MAG: hypothetical protein GY696_39775 [Gammaproteobacteria bacterium]|nr:hypothetical protein [Gammaproteobacteria bacterium]